MNVSARKVKSSRKHTIWFAVTLLTTFLGLLCFFSAWWYAHTYGRIGFDSVMFTLTGNLNGVNMEHLFGYLLGGALPAVAATALAGLGLYWTGMKRPKGIRWVTALVVAGSLGLTVHGAWNVGLLEYLIQSGQTSTIYEEHYVDPQTVQITFPEEKRNLVYIILESMEVSYLSTQQGGGMEVSLIPQLYELASANVNFSHNADVGGFRDVPGATWTMGAMVAQSGGIPLKVTEGTALLPGLNNLSDILRQQGYRQVLMVGSDSTFGGRKEYYQAHGVDTVYDLYTAWEDGAVPQGYDNQFWGIEDSQLYTYAKEKLTALSQLEQPFAFTMLTVDTHSPSGYLCQYCEDTWQEDYANVITCADRQIAEFISWLQTQDFYEDTTVVIVGDHSSMNNGFFERNAEEGYVRRLYNCFLNAVPEPKQMKNRDFSGLDLFPTTLAAMGCTMQGDRLGLGTNLFSEAPTLTEIYGYEGLCRELNKRSDFYEKYLEEKAGTMVLVP